MPTEPLYTLEEAAKIVGISIKTLRQHIRLGRLQYVNVGTGSKRVHRRFCDEDIAAFIEARECVEVPPPTPPLPARAVPNTISFSDIPKPTSRRR